MFERFTERARQVVVLAQYEARTLGHGYIGTEHILLGLIHEGHGVAAKALEAMDISLPTVRKQVEEIIGRGSAEPLDPIPFTPRAKKALELTWREAKLLGCDFVGTEHILLGLIHEGDGVAAQVLVKLGSDLDRARDQVSQLLSGKPGHERLFEEWEHERPHGASRIFAAGASTRPDEILARLNAVAMRLTAIERRLGILEARGQGHDALVSSHYRGTSLAPPEGLAPPEDCALHESRDRIPPKAGVIVVGTRVKQRHPAASDRRRRLTPRNWFAARRVV